LARERRLEKLQSLVLSRRKRDDQLTFYNYNKLRLKHVKIDKNNSQRKMAKLTFSKNQME